MLTLIRKARRRLLQNELFSQCANTFSAALIAFILLLLVGTQVLSWQLAAAVPVVAAAVGIYRALRRTPASYAVAQLVDRRLSLADTLSTAFFFSQEGAGGRVSSEVKRCQLESAEQLAQSVDIRQAVPYTLPRAAYAMAALVLVASSLFALRYGISRRLDLKPPLAQMLQEQFGWKPKTQVAQDTRRKNPKAPEAPEDDPGTAADDPNQKGSAEPQAAQNNDSEMAGQQPSDKNRSDPKGDPKQQADDSGKKGGEEGDAQAEEKSDPTGEPSENSQQGSNGKQTGAVGQ